MWSRVRLYLILSFACQGVFYVNPPVVEAQALTNNVTSVANAKWETGSHWSLGVPPSVNQAHIFFTNSFSKFLTIDSTTSDDFPSTLVVSNLTVAAPLPSINTLFLLSAGTAKPLRILNTLRIGNGGAATILNSSLSIEKVSGGNPADNPAFVIDGDVELVSGSITATNVVYIGESDTGTLTISGGTANFPDSIELGFASGSIGIVDVAGGTLEIDNHLISSFIGSSGKGQMTISGGTVNANNLAVGALSGSTGTLTLDGGTYSTQVPNSTAVGKLIIGSESGSSGVFWMKNGQFDGTNIAITIGMEGQGDFIQSNGVVKANATFVGSFEGSDGFVAIAGGSYQSIGRYLIGQGIGSIGEVLVTGGELISTNKEPSLGTIEIGADGIATMSVDGGTCQSLVMSIGAGVGQGFLTVSGGVVHTAEAVLGNCESAVLIDSGTFAVTNGSQSAVFDVGGAIAIDGGSIFVDKLVITNSCGRISRTGGSVNVGELELTPTMDADTDGLPNGWEQQFGFDALSGIGDDGANGDTDGDGFTHLEEFEAGTNPQDPSDLPIIIIEEVGGTDIKITIQTVIGKNYQLQFRDSLTTGLWMDAGAAIEGDGAKQAFIDSNGALATMRFYRVRISSQ